MNDRSHVHERPWQHPLVVICSDMQQSIYISCVFLLCLGSKRHCRSPAFPYQEQYIPLGLGQLIHNLSPHLIQPLSSCLQSIPVPFVHPQISISPTPLCQFVSRWGVVSRSRDPLYSIRITPCIISK